MGAGFGRQVRLLAHFRHARDVKPNAPNCNTIVIGTA